MTKFVVQTTLDRDDKEKYPCHGSLTCTSSWTYDNWHCTGCHWKGMGTADLEYGTPELRAHAAKLKARLVKEAMGI